ncbi:MAG TPA: ferritin-like domain-containing protein [Ilumatobacteraceae bacterium]|nr:ferritin-like domain-containing protein [Ilumatobacteraceae bacterium]
MTAALRSLPMHPDLDADAVNDVLNQILEVELSGVVRYTHSSLIIVGPNRIPLVAFMKAQAGESLVHAQQVGEILTGLGGHPTARIAPIEDNRSRGIHDILADSLGHELRALELYRSLLSRVEGKSVFLEEFARVQISAEEQHQLELRKMMRDFAEN